MNENNYCVYCHENKINGKKYFGQTKNNPKQRWKNGCGYRDSPLFYNAILKYGWDNFYHYIVKENLTLEQANFIEEEFIKCFNTQDRKFGYNIRSGGENFAWDSEARHKLSTVMKNLVDSDPLKYGRKQVFQYTLEGEYMASYESASKAMQITGIAEGSIRGCCHHRKNNKSAGGFMWEYYKVDKLDTIYCRNSGGQNGKKIIQKDLSGNFIKEWPSIGAIIKELNISRYNILACCENKKASVNDYIWEYKK